MYRGDIALGDTIDLKFTTRSFTTGAPTTLSGSPAIAAYVGNSTTEITAGITLTVDFDSRTGLNNVRVVATSGNGYAAGTNVELVITAGTVGGVSVVGEVIGAFSINNRISNVTQWNGTAVSTPATAGIPDVNVKNINNVAAATPGASGGLLISGSNSGTTTLGALTVTGATTLTGAVSATNASNDVRGVLLQATQTGVTIPTVTTVTNQLTAAAIATGVWQDTTAGDFTVASSIGKSLYTSGVAPGASGGLLIAGSNAATTFATLTSTGAFTINGTSNVAQTGDSFGRIGATGSGLTSLAPASTALSTAQWTNTLATNLGTLAGHDPGSTLAAASDVAAVPGDVWDVARSGHTTSGTFGEAVDATLSYAVEIDRAIVGAVGSVSGTPSASAFDTSLTQADDFWDDALLVFYSGSLAGQSRPITTYAQTNGRVTFDEPFTSAPSASDLFTIRTGHTHPVTQVAGAVWDVTLASHLTSGSTGAALNAAGSAGDPWATTLPGAYGAGTAGFIIGTNIDALVSSRLAPTTAGRTLDVTATGGAGIDWANVENQSTAVNLSGTTVNLVNTLTTYTGNTPQTGDSFARIGATGSGLTSLAPSATALSTVQWTNTLATNLGTTNSTVATNLDATISSRAAAATALSTAQWTNTLATNLGTTNSTVATNLDVAVSTRASATVAPSWYSSPTTPPTTAQIATAVWTDLLASSDFSTVGSVGKLLKDDIDAAISSRMATFTLPTNFSTLLISVSGHISNVDTLTTYTGNTPQTGDCYPGTVKVQAAVYDSATASGGNTLTLSNGKTQTFAASGTRTTSP